MEAQRRGTGWGPYVVPYASFGLLAEVQARTPHDIAPYMLIFRVALTAALVLFFFLRGDYPELRSWRPTLPGAFQDVLLGLVTTVVWVAPYVLFPALPRRDPQTAFRPYALGTTLAPIYVAIRFAGFALVTPFMEELFIRSFLIRYLDVFDTGEDFRDVPMARFRWRSFIGTWLAFTFSHLPWEYPVAAATGLLWNLWLYRRKHLASVVLVHAVTNGSLFLLVALGSGHLHDLQGHVLDLWYFL
ncbi:MAG TPA: CAAX prenyl protease-related protein [Deltaproteobacteria bacterium]|nr:CAAX prenyl protease-related protein [Deltaproteobacteria bacterium]